MAEHAPPVADPARVVRAPALARALGYSVATLTREIGAGKVPAPSARAQGWRAWWARDAVAIVEARGGAVPAAWRAPVTEVRGQVAA